MKKVNIKASADVGNSSTKIIVLDGVGIKARIQPTLTSYLPTIPRFEDEDVNTLVANLHKSMIVHITSPSITRNGLYAVGESSYNHGGEGFNIKHHKKAEHNTTIIQPLSMIAATMIQNEFSKHNELPESLTLNVEYATAIPVVDYSKAGSKQLEERLKGTHILVVYIGEGVQCHVTINVDAARVIQEGIPALYALVEGGSHMFTDYNKLYGVNYSGKDFANRKMLFVDIGDGTTELITIVDGKPVITKSKGIRAGVGHASELAIAAFKENNGIESDLTRSEFMKKVLDNNDKWHGEAMKELNLAIDGQEDKIFIQVKDVIENTLSYDVDDVVIFGGGAKVFNDLEMRLIEYANRYKIRVLCIKGKEATLMNVIGLDELNKRVLFRKKVQG